VDQEYPRVPSACLPVGRFEAPLIRKRATCWHAHTPPARARGRVSWRPGAPKAQWSDLLADIDGSTQTVDQSWQRHDKTPSFAGVPLPL